MFQSLLGHRCMCRTKARACALIRSGITIGSWQLTAARWWQSQTFVKKETKNPKRCLGDSPACPEISFCRCPRPLPGAFG